MWFTYKTKLLWNIRALVMIVSIMLRRVKTVGVVIIIVTVRVSMLCVQV